jgi:DNA-binding MarR family transcriptional regulator
MSNKLKVKQIDSLEGQLTELQQLLSQVVLWFQDKGASAAELDPLKRKFFDAGLRERHMRVLLALSLSGPLTIGDLAAKLGLTSATTSLLAGELNRAGFLNRREDDNDRRRTIVSLPDRVRAPLEQVTNVKLAALRRTLEQLDPAAREHFLEGLRLLAGEATAEAPPGTP